MRDDRNRRTAHNLALSRRATLGLLGSSAAALAFDLAPGGAFAEAAATGTVGQGSGSGQGAGQGPRIIRSHGYSYFGDLTYAEDFPHFGYVNPDAPKGGEISTWAPGTFDSMNPYSRKGRAGRFSWITAESLLGEMPFEGGPLPADVYGEMYGLLAHSLEYPETKDWVIFHMRPEARFADGTPVTAEDVVFTHELFLEQGLPSYALAVRKRVPRAEVLDTHVVKFYFTPGISRRSLIDQVGSTPVFSKAWFERTGARLDESRLEPAMGSGAYVLESYDINRRIVWKRNPDYWGWHLPINRGRLNFDRVRVEYFADDAAAFEAFKAGEYTYRAENNSRRWATGYDFPAVQKGWVKRESIPDGTPPTPTGFVFNLLRDKFKDKRVREAISLAYNFEWTNASLQYGLFKQRHSFVQGADFEARGKPEGKERELLESLGSVVPPELLEQEAVRAHSSNPDKVVDRRNKRRALKLFEEAGWKIGEDGFLHNDKGERFTLEFLISSSDSATLESIVSTFVNNLRAFGVDARVEKVDPAQFTARRRDKDYDMIFSGYASFLEAGTGLYQRFGSEDAVISIFNPASLQSPLVDAIIDAALKTTSREDEETALMALDRALRYERFMIPVWYNDEVWLAYYDMYEHPEKLPKYAVGVYDFWWYNPEKHERLKAAGALRY